MELGATPKIKPRKQCVSPSQQETMIGASHYLTATLAPPLVLWSVVCAECCLLCGILTTATTDSLPDEVLEHILALVSPYQELSSSARVCSRSQQS